MKQNTCFFLFLWLSVLGAQLKMLTLRLINSIGRELKSGLPIRPPFR